MCHLIARLIVAAALLAIPARPAHADICMACDTASAPVVGHPHGSQWNGRPQPAELVWGR